MIKSNSLVGGLQGGGAMDAAKQLVNEAILENLDLPKCHSSNTIRVADLGCAVGPNTFFQVQNILDAVELKYRTQGLNSQIPEFQVFFNDQTSNDFNTLFASLPPNRRYHAAGVPGSFYCRLFPNASLHVVYSSFAIHWLSAVPKEMADRSSPGWNKGRIYHLNAADEVTEGYSAQHAKDMAQFLDARAQEVVEGGLMILFFPGRPDGTPPSQFISNMLLHLLGSCLMDMAKKGKVSEEKVDSFNLPIYIMSSQELKEAIDRNGCFSVVKLESLFEPGGPRHTAQETALNVRSVMEGLVKEQFGDEILEEVFDSYVKKIEEEYSLIDNSVKAMFLFAVLKRKTIN